MAVGDQLPELLVQRVPIGVLASATRDQRDQSIPCTVMSDRGLCECVCRDQVMMMAAGAFLVVDQEFKEHAFPVSTSKYEVVDGVESRGILSTVFL